jgi:hypothetical protein
MSIWSGLPRGNVPGTLRAYGSVMSEADPAATPGPAARRFRLASPVTALAAAAVVLVLMIAEFPLASLAHQTVGGSSGGGPLWFSVPFEVIGFLVAYRKPGNRLGWILIGLAGFLTVAEDASFYVVACYRLRHGGVPFGWVALLAQSTWSIAIVLVGLAFLLSPTAICRRRGCGGCCECSWPWARSGWPAPSASP